ncbi:FAD:protein FMN transferase [Deinococcus pimensis]|uniref:FAD:protein FMN transferase n=1 Tax=Deinococcus pimensis TaxID=309888 RepID=UPI0004AF13EF|nr:FAD:protein FMN transferase [Deinococcus pimensis]
MTRAVPLRSPARRPLRALLAFLVRRPVRHDVTYERVLGSALHLRVDADDEDAARSAEAALLAEIDRLEAVFSRVNPDSELNRWQARPGEDVPVSAELHDLLRDALDWQRRTKGAFNPSADAFVSAWRHAEGTGRPPLDEALDAAARAAGEPAFVLGAGTARVTRPGGLTLNAVAKGAIADAAALAAFRVPGVRGVLVNLGGDLRHVGEGEVRVAVSTSGVENHAEDVVTLRGGALATSGGAHRGFLVGGTWYPHTLDPRTGRPATEVRGASVLAPDARTADVLATALSVLPVTEGLDLVRNLPNVGCLVVTADGARHTDPVWCAHSRPS